MEERKKENKTRLVIVVAVVEGTVGELEIEVHLKHHTKASGKAYQP